MTVVCTYEVLNLYHCVNHETNDKLRGRMFQVFVFASVFSTACMMAKEERDASLKTSGIPCFSLFFLPLMAHLSFVWIPRDHSTSCNINNARLIRSSSRAYPSNCRGGNISVMKVS